MNAKEIDCIITFSILCITVCGVNMEIINEICIAATYDLETDSVFQHFGHTRNFKIYRIRNGKVVDSRIVDNGGFGHHDLASYLKELGVSTLILGNRGQGAIDALNNAGISQIAGVTGNPDEAVESLLKGTLVHNPNAVCSHHHH